MRVQKGTAVTVRTEPFDDTPSAVTVAAVRTSDGSTISTAPTGAVINNSVDVSLTAAAHTDELDELTVTVSATVDSLATLQIFTVDIVGSHYMTVGSLRAEPQLSDAARYPDALIAEFRDEMCEYVERAANVAYTPSFAQETWVGNGTSVIVLRTHGATSLTSLTIDGVAQTVSGFELLDGGLLHYKSGVFTAGEPIVVSLEHGYVRPPPQLNREVKHAIRSNLLSRSSQAPSNRLWEQTPDGLTVRYSTPDWAERRFTGMMDLDAAILAYRWPDIGFA